MDTLILFGYSVSMILGFASVGTVIYYSLSRNTRYEKKRNKFAPGIHPDIEIIVTDRPIVTE